jgi:hypothetical protein
MGTEAAASPRRAAGAFLTTVIACDKRKAFAQGSEAIHYAVPERWIASSRSLSSGAHARDPLAPLRKRFNASRLSQAMKETIYRRR